MTHLSSFPFLKWTGGKRRLLPHLLPLIPAGKRLIEPFVGAGSVFLACNFSRLLLADNNPHLISLYRHLQRDATAVAEAVRGLFVEANRTPEAYLALRERFNSKDTDPLSRAALFIYINRFGYNGLYRTNRLGECNTSYADLNRVPGFQEEALLRFAKRLQPAELCCDDFEKIMEQAEAGDVVYCDPPYAAEKDDKRCFTAYGKQGFFWDDQQRLADKARELAERGVQVVISNHDTASTRELYIGAQLHHLEVRRSIAAKAKSRRTAHELVAVFAPESVAARDSDRTLTTGYPRFCSPPRGSTAVSPGPSGRGV
jgi:DNA adenine methylase